jgi:dTDP-4-amino-4,6-dideoxygalactose transaminase
MKVEYYRHSLSKEDLKLANKVMKSTFLTTGPMVSEFEKKFSDYLKLPGVVGLTSCTGAIHLALLRKGIGPGDEVITTPMTFVATAAAIIQTGAKPVLVDVCKRSGLLLPESVERAITSKTKGIVVVHLYGRMVDMAAFSALARKHGLALIEDAAHCIEGMRKGIRPGQLSDAACFSFYATKSMTCGEGGALACRSEDDASWYRSARHHGISKDAYKRYTKEYTHWDMEMFGWKYNMSDIQAALLMNQIDRLGENLRKRQELEGLYRESLKDVEGLDFIEPVEDEEVSGHHLFTVLVPKTVSRDRVLKGMQEKGIGCAVNYRAIHTLRYFREHFGYRPEDLPAAYEIGERTLTLPLYSKLSEKSVNLVCKTLIEVIKEAELQ